MRGAVLVAMVIALGSVCYAAEGPAPWLPNESWPGGRQADARLDQPVRFWGAGMPLATVFAQVKEQTGVELGFSPPDDQNTRLCVNLYLNPDRPATLRDLLAQLSWVTQCSFVVSAEEPRRYWLVGTSVGLDAVGKLRARGAREQAMAEAAQGTERAKWLAAGETPRGGGVATRSAGGCGRGRGGARPGAGLRGWGG